MHQTPVTCMSAFDRLSVLGAGKGHHSGALTDLDDRTYGHTASRDENVLLVMANMMTNKGTKDPQGGLPWLNGQRYC